MSERSKSSVQKLLDERISLSETIRLATIIVGCYPASGERVSDTYLGAIAETLTHYPASVARQCADIHQGIAAYCKGYPLPQITDIIAYCEGFTEPLRKQVDTEKRRGQQFEDREEFLIKETIDRKARLSIDELKQKYGDWHDNWRPPGEKERLLGEKARADLIAQIGKEAFDALPDNPKRVT